ncbi:uncharacterized protein LOC131304445 isoform X2 [Rhododendron vialii]|uniref:uncharacterized protein LOC131304445 isoform X2 n=1 Tax=Rhododendron vialii TaxID=182163 RepID=UPI00265F885F|nr:uncharacterized protein LOC131304445 isoform X2 [Rhododendron vialii]
MGLKTNFEPLRIQILNTSPMPSLYEVFATIDSEEHRRRIIQPQGLLATPTISIVNDQMAFAASSRPPSGKIICHHCGDSGHVKARCYKLHPELKPRVTRNRSYDSSSSGPSRTVAFAENTGISAPLSQPNYSHLQSQIGQLQEQLGNLTARAQSAPSTSTATLAVGPGFEKDFWQGI